MIVLSAWALLVSHLSVCTSVKDDVAMKDSAIPVSKVMICENVVNASGVKSLNCSHRGLKNLEAFQKDQHLPYSDIDLSYNLITTVTEDGLIQFTKNLNFSHNAITIIEAGALDKLIHLQKLDLSFNSLTQLSKDVFMSLGNLKFLDISSNFLKTLPNALPMLEMLDVSNNSIEVVEETLYSVVLYPQQVFLIGQNPLVCDCGTVWLKELLDTRKYILKFARYIQHDKFFPTCNNPDNLNLKYKSWLSISDAEFCDDSRSHDTKSDIEINIEHVSDKTKLPSVFIEAEDIGPTSIQIKWTIPLDTEGLSIKITYHRFGKKQDRKTVILPAEASGYRLKRLKPATPYIVCYNVFSGAAVQSHDCLEVKTKKTDAKITQSYFSWTYILLFIQKYGFVMWISVLVIFIPLYFMKDSSTTDNIDQ